MKLLHKIFLIFIAIWVMTGIVMQPCYAIKKHKIAGPVKGRISSPFGQRIDPFSYSRRFHSGIDIAANYGEPIYALQEGIVTFSGWKGGYGHCIIIDHQYPNIPKIPRVQTKYAHNSKNVVKIGQRIKRGDIIGYIGSTGRSTGPHLHFEVIYKGKAINPIDYIKKLPGYLDYISHIRKQKRYTSYKPNN